MNKNDIKIKNVRMKHRNSTNSQKQYLRCIIHNLSLQRLTDQEIVDYLNNEKNIDIARSTVTGIKNKIEKEAEKWYIELRQSRYKFIATYKERLDSLLSYQKKLNDIISTARKPETQIRAISELHSIENSIFSLWKQLPNLTIVDSQTREDSGYNRDEQPMINRPPRAILRTGPEDEEHDRAVYLGWKKGDPPLNGLFRTRMEEMYGADIEPWDMEQSLQCSKCERWFKTRETLYAHTCLPKPMVGWFTLETYFSFLLPI